ncbi:hypothetical protein [Streptomyces sp. KR55]|uniref:hypothetical protein n=1 Tax=Streptomyces sp. KR55 TaxID=3457425 RepID=UPI003FCF3569
MARRTTDSTVTSSAGLLSTGGGAGASDGSGDGPGAWPSGGGVPLSPPSVSSAGSPLGSAEGDWPAGVVSPTGATEMVGSALGGQGGRPTRIGEALLLGSVSLAVGDGLPEGGVLFGGCDGPTLGGGYVGGAAVVGAEDGGWLLAPLVHG